MQTIEAEDLKQKRLGREELLLGDVLAKKSFADAHLRGATDIPVGSKLLRNVRTNPA